MAEGLKKRRPTESNLGGKICDSFILKDEKLSMVNLLGSCLGCIEKENIDFGETR